MSIVAAVSDLRALIAASRVLRRQGRPYLLATLVSARGSSYRRPGARLLITEDRAALAGSVSGGCLERDLARRGWWTTADGCPALVTYDSTSDEDDLGWGLGLGCNGVVELLLERFGAGAGGEGRDGPRARDGAGAGEAEGGGGHAATAAGEKDRGARRDPDAGVARAPLDPLVFIEDCLRDEIEGALVTVFRSKRPALPVGARLALRRGAAPSTALGSDRAATMRADGWGGGGESGDGDGPGGQRALLELAAAALADDGPDRRVGDSGRSVALEAGAVEALVEVIRPPPHLFVLGCGPDALPVVTLARALGWTVTVWDPQSRFETRARFAAADHLFTGGASALAASIEASARPLAVVMSHSADRDREALAMLLPSKVGYLGVLGPRRRTDRLLAELARTGARLGPRERERLHAPVGLDLGAETPDEVALAIVAEAQAALSGAGAGALRDRGGAIHAPSPPPAGLRAAGGE